MMRNECDILVSGAGIAGMAAARGLAAQGFRVCLVDPSPPVQDAGHDRADLRSTAFLRPARTLFEDLDLWPALADHATPLDALRLVDTVGMPPRIRESRTFLAGDLGVDSFGWNLPNWLTRRELARALEGTERLEVRWGTGFAGMLVRDREVRVKLTDGTRIRTRLVLGLDGRRSAVAEAAGIDTRVTRYGQKALALAVTHDAPHGNVSTEIYNSGGAFVTVPLPDHDGHPASAVVWMEDGPRALDLSRLDETALAQALTARSCGLLGPMRPATAVRLWPVVTQRAARLTGRRTALAAEAAHVLPPIGAQGLNTSLADVAALLDALRDRPDPGAEAPLAAYARARARDLAARTAAIDMFNRICRSGSAPVQDLRLAGLRAVHGLAPLRRAVMRAGLGEAAG
ncbi:MAG: FAD-dependent monooxygenase [Tranquillimonas sp.]